MSTPSELVAYTLNRLQPDIPVYRENQKDGDIKLPSFFVQQLATQTQFKVSDEQMREYNFDIVYLVDQYQHPGQPSPVERIETMNEFMMNNLEWLVDKDGTIIHRIRDLSTDVQNGDLHISFSFTSRLGQTEEGVAMKKLIQKGGFYG
ncbi:hypothetical protein PT274_01440 [Leuconostocaceae bacterium ESL0958]|nr:hypothetical protein [Leuconostocaceae bacterium ESL0958]